MAYRVMWCEYIHLTASAMRLDQFLKEVRSLSIRSEAEVRPILASLDPLSSQEQTFAYRIRLSLRL